MAVGADIGGMLGIHDADGRLGGNAAAVPEERLQIVLEVFLVLRADQGKSGRWRSRPLPW